jgi:hypothetical protein
MICIACHGLPLAVLTPRRFSSPTAARAAGRAVSAIAGRTASARSVVALRRSAVDQNLCGGYVAIDERLAAEGFHDLVEMKSSRASARRRNSSRLVSIGW